MFCFNLLNTRYLPLPPPSQGSYHERALYSERGTKLDETNEMIEVPAPSPLANGDVKTCLRDLFR